MAECHGYPEMLDLSLGETGAVCLATGEKNEISLISLREEKDSLRPAVRRVIAGLNISGAYEELEVSNYNLPKCINGIKIDLPVCRGFEQSYRNGEPVHNITKDVRIRYWDPQRPYMEPGEFKYPVKQAWFVTNTQMGNEPCYVDNADVPERKSVYYHFGLDIGGFDKSVPVVAAVGGVVVCKGEKVLESERRHPVEPGYDNVFIKDKRNWYYYYSHLAKIDENLKLGEYLSAGSPLGILGKEGGSGGWSHLHFHILAPDKSGKYIIFDGYAFLVEAYLREHPGALLACARPHKLIKTGEAAFFDGTKSICSKGQITDFTWRFSDGTTVSHPKAYKVYKRPGTYSEKLFVTDEKGNIDADFCIVQVILSENPANVLPSIHATYYPAENILVGQSIAFKARTFNVKGGEEKWDFGDGGTAVTCSHDEYDQTSHTYKKPGLYLAEVRRTSLNGFSAATHCKVLVNS